ncbi:MAG: hypothetical protein MSA32_02080 [Bacteroidales bacterium]|nr:hypothetical protein [Bacteroidales bacterium]
MKVRRRHGHYGYPSFCGLSRYGVTQAISPDNLLWLPVIRLFSESWQEISAFFLETWQVTSVLPVRSMSAPSLFWDGGAVIYGACSEV